MSGSSFDIQEVGKAIQSERRTKASASKKVGGAWAYQAIWR
jgi:hypothetical protein